MTELWFIENFEWIIVAAGFVYILWIFYRRDAEERKRRRDKP